MCKRLNQFENCLLNIFFQLVFPKMNVFSKKAYSINDIIIKAIFSSHKLLQIKKKRRTRHYLCTKLKPILALKKQENQRFFQISKKSIT